MNVKVPSDSDYQEYNGAHCFRLWRLLTKDWRCPGCDSSKREIMRWATCYKKRPDGTREPYKGWVAGLHKHHDHGADHVLQAFFVASLGEDYYKWQQRYEAAMRFPETVVCDQCNAADGRAKRKLGLPCSGFSFSPAEIRQFVLPTPHGPHKLCLETARRVFREVVGDESEGDAP